MESPQSIILFDPSTSAAHTDQFPPGFPLWPFQWYRDRWKRVQRMMLPGGPLSGWRGVPADYGEFHDPAGPLVVIAWLAAKWGAIEESVEGRAAKRGSEVKPAATKGTATTWWNRMCAGIQKDPTGSSLRELEDVVMQSFQIFESGILARGARDHRLILTKEEKRIEADRTRATATPGRCEPPGAIRA